MSHENRALQMILLHISINFHRRFQGNYWRGEQSVTIRWEQWGPH
jgi:hypothetical protein